MKMSPTNLTLPSLSLPSLLIPDYLIPQPMPNQCPLWFPATRTHVVRLFFSCCSIRPATVFVSQVTSIVHPPRPLFGCSHCSRLFRMTTVSESSGEPITGKHFTTGPNITSSIPGRRRGGRDPGTGFSQCRNRKYLRVQSFMIP